VMAGTSSYVGEGGGQEQGRPQDRGRVANNHEQSGCRPWPLAEAADGRPVSDAQCNDAGDDERAGYRQASHKSNGQPPAAQPRNPGRDMVAPAVDQTQSQCRRSDRGDAELDDVDGAVPGYALQSQMCLTPTQRHTQTDCGAPDARGHHTGHCAPPGQYRPLGRPSNGCAPPRSAAQHPHSLSERTARRVLTSR